MEAFIQFILARWAYQQTGTTDDAAMKRARINHVFRQDDAYSKWEAAQLSKCKTLRDKLKLIILGRFFISTPVVGTLMHMECSTEEQSALVSQWQAWEDAGVLFNPCIRMECQIPRTVVAEQFWCNTLYHLSTIEELIRAHATAYELWSYLDGALPRYNIVPGLDSFRVYEMITSLSYLLETDFTEYDFFFVGPGARNILQGLFGSVPRTVWEANQMATQVSTLLMGFGFPCPVSFRVVEDCACEYRKYLRSVELGDELPEKYRYYPGARTCTR